MSQETKELALILRDRLREKQKLTEYHRHAVSYLFKVFEEMINEMKADLQTYGGDPNQIKMYKAPSGDYIVVKMGDSLSSVYSMPDIKLCSVEVQGQSGLCGRVVVFQGDYRNLEIDDPEQLATIEDDSLFIFPDSVLYHIVSPVGLHRTDIPRFAHLVLSKMIQKDEAHYSPILDEIVHQQEAKYQ
ncbi:hypothetical protein COW36_23470 [bacterium (Candidatus Blackallbacteria) CG17_big_fil_post_rev_8_21_14_2_50_48_46]|uniref:Uncharacterized protein n=1 Tax=bacterium (Candidatus Blackallbacteria) CG17_big_fil_post_rev_8_21_14_2_50_48_46 TaxID=2014261 RepID=A0A2M7FXU6_9BACT|nr:MAG: hypothetical protein COW64_17680 [bacterium (Candidatus Blackallbacteria) CG18_big_fil_WC_8_21_14_2_50_49_26]PIW14002.1 MAG: hypothetical protein COW36_23470 [bacterium (Candidatus Blackallbacteria) CG17_big_fil_post_rev_8_21_14_2_50_48_46]PIW46853.1 MAG: hypothetical protein COW20_14645 [bacterium (Candidatus Blackallbacteria) CG13_big_fil_rev_8_21_14_2_50_49_14]